jgi:hypothetical protein
MKQSTIDAIRAAHDTFLRELNKAPIPQEGHWVYERGTDGSWRGAFVLRPSTYGLLAPHEPFIERLSSEMSPVLVADYPDHMKGVGLPGVGIAILQPRMILGVLAYETLRRYGTFAINHDQMEDLLDDVAGFFDRPNIRVRLSAPLLNLHGSREVPPIAFPGDIIMRPITDEEVTSFYGGNPIFNTGSRLLAFPSFLFVREVDVPKVVGDFSKIANESFWRPTQEMFDRLILAISSFKDGGPIGYDGVRVTPVEMAFGATSGGQFGSSEHVPVGHYELTPEEAPRLELYAKLFEDIHPSLEIACQRLVDATRRTKVRDSIVDAVIGLESILLVEVGEKQRSETRFRFSLNYASLFPVEERHDAFHTARDLYDLRSLIAHGGEPSSKQKINGNDMALHQIAPLARSVLRETLARFMPNSAKPHFLSNGYWVTKVLGL